jgi:hypothetical protein
MGKCEDFGDYYCEACESEYFDIIDLLVKDIKHLETKAVYLRYTLSWLLPDEYDGKMLRSDIFSDLTPNHCEHPAYRRYVARYYRGRDPKDNWKYAKLLMRISRGEKTIGL